MNKTLFIYLALLFCISQTAFGQSNLTVNNPTAGSLVLQVSNPEEVIDLSISGNLNATDFKFMRDDMPNLKYLDIANTSIVAYSGTGGTIASGSYLANVIPQSAFYAHPSLRKIVLPNNITEIQKSAFDKCSLEELEIPNSVTRIYDGAFQDNNFLARISLGSGLSKIDNQAFYDCKKLRIVEIKTISPPTLSGSAFSFTNLSMIFVPAQSLTAYKSAAVWSNYNIGLDQLTTVSGVTPGTLSSKLSNAATITKLKVIGSINNTDIAYIKSSMGYLLELDLSEVSIANNTLPASAFASSSILKNVILPESLEHIGDNAFASCVNFDGSVPLPKSLKTIGTKAFYNCKMIKGPLSFPEGLLSIGDNAFENCEDIEGEINFPSTLQSIGSIAFKACSSLTGSIILPNSLTSIGGSAFMNCGGLDGDIVLSESLTTIPASLFYNCSNITGTLSIPQSVTSIGNNAFYNCSSIENLVLPSGLTSVGTNAFYRFSNLNSIYSFATTPAAINSKTFNQVNKTTTQLVVPASATAAYSSANYWNEFLNILAHSVSYSTTIDYDTNEATVKQNNQTVLSGSSVGSYEMEPLKLEITPKAGYELVEAIYGGDDVTHLYSNGILVLNDVVADKTLSLSFDQISHSIHTSIEGNGSVKINDVSVDNNSATSVYEAVLVTIEIEPDDWNYIESFKIDGIEKKQSLVNGVYEIESVEADTDIKVVFAETMFDVNISRSANGTIKHDGVTLNATATISVKGGEPLTLEILPDEEYRVSQVLFNNNDVKEFLSNNSLTIPSITSNSTLSVQFEEKPEICEFTFNISGNGTVKFNDEVVNSTSTKELEYDELASLYMEADPHHEIKVFTINGVDKRSALKNNEYSFQAESSAEIVVEFGPIMHTITVDIIGNGLVVVDVDPVNVSVDVMDGSDVSFLFDPEVGYKLSLVKYGGVDRTSAVSNNVLTINNVTEAATLRVEFEEQNYLITFKDPEAKASLQLVKKHGEELLFTFDVNGSNWQVSSVKANGTSLTPDDKDVYTITSIEEDVEISVTYSETPTGVPNAVNQSDIHVYSKDSRIYIEGMELGDLIMVYDNKGALVYKGTTSYATEIIDVEVNQIYIVQTPKMRFKLISQR